MNSRVPGAVLRKELTPSPTLPPKSSRLYPLQPGWRFQLVNTLIQVSNVCTKDTREKLAAINRERMQSRRWRRLTRKQLLRLFGSKEIGPGKLMWFNFNRGARPRSPRIVSPPSNCCPENFEIECVTHTATTSTTSSTIQLQ